jgi:arylsulfatase A-like enzyme
LLAFWQREFGRSQPTRLGDLVVFPLGISATFGLIAGVWFAAHRHFLDPLFIAYSIGVDVLIQILILLLALTLAFITRRKIWSGVLLAIAFFCFLAIPDLVKLALPGVDHRLDLLIGLLGAFQIARTINRHPHSRFALWMIAVPALAATCVLSYGPVREISLRRALPKPPNSPNVLIIIADTLRSDHLSTYGYSRDTSPNLTHLAQQGVLFENAIAPASWTLPSHASILTGLYPHDDHVENERDILSGSLPTLGNAMRSRGYRTAAFSANYFFFSRDHGFNPGFLHFEEFEQSFSGILEKVPFSEFILKKIYPYTNGAPGAFLGVKNAPTAGKIDADALAWIGNGGRPFFVVLNYVDVHEPVLPPEPYLHRYTADAKARRESMFFPVTCSLFGTGRFCDLDRPQFDAVYDGAVRYVDQSTQDILVQLNERGLLQNTIVVFTSDHGQELGEHGMYGHEKSLFRQELQVPLIISKPGLVPASVRVSTPVSPSEIPATILDLVDSGQMQADKQSLPGQSLAALWRSGEPVSGWPEPLSELARIHGFDKAAPNYNAPAWSIVTPEWHYIYQQGKDLLFDWKADPDETHDLSASHPAECAEFRGRMQSSEGTRPQAH